jgi:hypothetical protein
MPFSALWIDKVFNFAHSKLAYAKEAGSWGYLIAERFTDCGRGEGNAAVVVFEKLCKIEKLSLGSLGAESTSQ